MSQKECSARYSARHAQELHDKRRTDRVRKQQRAASARWREKNIERVLEASRQRRAAADRNYERFQQQEKRFRDSATERRLSVPAEIDQARVISLDTLRRPVFRVWTPRGYNLERWETPDELAERLQA